MNDGIDDRFALNSLTLVVPEQGYGWNDFDSGIRFMWIFFDAASIRNLDAAWLDHEPLPDLVPIS